MQKLPADQKRKYSVGIRVTKDEQDEIEKACKMIHTQKSTLAYDLLMREIRKILTKAEKKK